MCTAHARGARRCAAHQWSGPNAICSNRWSLTGAPSRRSPTSPAPAPLRPGFSAGAGRRGASPRRVADRPRCRLCYQTAIEGSSISRRRPPSALEQKSRRVLPRLSYAALTNTSERGWPDGYQWTINWPEARLEPTCSCRQAGPSLDREFARLLTIPGDALSRLLLNSRFPTHESVHIEQRRHRDTAVSSRL